MIITKKVPSYDEKLLRQCYNFLSNSYKKLYDDICSWETFLEYRNYVYIMYDDHSDSNENNTSKTVTTTCNCCKITIKLNSDQLDIKGVFVFNRELHDKTFPLKFYCQEDGSLFVIKYIAFTNIEHEILVSSLKSIMVEMNYTSVIYIGIPPTNDIDFLLTNAGFRVVYFYQVNKEIRVYVKDPTTSGYIKKKMI